MSVIDLAILSATAVVCAGYEQIAQVAESRATVLIRGESGTGKELVARAIHLPVLSGMVALIAVNCAAFPEHLVESELFGHEKALLPALYKDVKAGLKWRMAARFSG